MIGLRLADSTVIALMLYPIVILYKGEWAEYYETLGLLSFFFSLLIFHSMGLYRPWRGQKYVGEFKIILKAWLTTIFLILFLLFAFKVAPKFSRVVLTAWFTTVPLVLSLLHGMARMVLRFIRAMGKNQRTSVIVGAGDLGLFLAKYIVNIPWAGIKVLGFFDDHKTSAELSHNGQAGKTVLGTISELQTYLENNDVDYVYITLPMRAERKIHEILNTCRTMGAQIFLVPDIYAFSLFNSRLQTLGELLILDFNPNSNSKRLFDVFFSLVAILITLPLTLTIALLIKLQDRGPVFYGHRRITATGKEFFCLKFRTMYVDADKRLEEILKNDAAAKAEWMQTFKLKNDPRVTPIGRFLRKCSLDELPQFLNVLKGEMSVVGARPIISQELSDFYKENSGIYCSIKPGITGIWQVSQRSDTKDYQERVELDVWYALNRNFWLDIKIIFRTIGCMISGKGAY